MRIEPFDCTDKNGNRWTISLDDAVPGFVQGNSYVMTFRADPIPQGRSILVRVPVTKGLSTDNNPTAKKLIVECVIDSVKKKSEEKGKGNE